MGRCAYLFSIAFHFETDCCCDSSAIALPINGGQRARPASEGQAENRRRSFLAVYVLV
jgi:hypothetical protein